MPVTRYHLITDAAELITGHSYEAHHHTSNDAFRGLLLRYDPTTQEAIIETAPTAAGAISRTININDWYLFALTE